MPKSTGCAKKLDCFWLWTALVRNDLLERAMYQIVAFFVENNIAIKINNLTVAH